MSTPIPPDDSFEAIPPQYPSFAGGLLKTVLGAGALGAMWYGLSAATGQNLVGQVLHTLTRGLAGTGGLEGTILGRTLFQAEKLLAAAPAYELKAPLEAKIKETLAQGFGAPSKLGVGYTPLTVGQALEKGLFSETESGLVERALKRGWIGEGTQVDRQIFLSQAGALRDLRFFSSYGASKLAEKSRFLGYPQLLADLFPSRPLIAQLGYKFRGQEATRFYYFGGDVYAAYQTQLRKVAERQLLHRRGGPLQLTRAVLYGEAEITEPPAGFLDKLLAPLGLGRRYATRQTTFERFFLTPLRNIRALATGEGVAVRRPWRYEEEAATARLLFGGTFPEAFSTTSGHIVPTNAPPFEQASFWEKLQAVFGASSNYVIARREAVEEATRAGRGITAKDLVVPLKRGAVTSIESPISRDRLTKQAALGQYSLTAGGNVSPFLYPEYYATPRGILPWMRETANYLAIRLNALAGESILGIGFKPSKRLSVNLLRLAGIPVVYEGLRQAVLAADYTIEKLTGVSPIKGAAWMYAQARLGQQWLRDVLGITTAAQWLEQKFPGSVQSGASFFTRTLALPAGTLFYRLFKTGSVAKAALAAGLVYGAIGGPGLTQTHQELAEEYAGIRQVPVRSGRFWALGYRSFLGGRITHFAPSWYVRLQHDAWYKSVYGSKEAYFEHQNIFGFPFPTPWNLFGIRNLLDPYWYEKATYYRRPTPYTAPLFQEFPLFGPLLSSTLGEIIKPLRRMHGLEALGGPRTSSLPIDVKRPSFVASRLGIPALPPTANEALTPGEFAMRARMMGEAALAPLGVHDFMLQQFGLRPKPPERHVQTALDSIAVARELETAGLGGFFGQCFVAGTMVTTMLGDKPIETIEAGDYVLSGDGQWRRVVKRADMGEASDLYRVVIPSIGRELIVTSKHHIPIATPEHPESLVDTEVRNIRPGDRVVCPIPEPFLEIEKIPGWDFPVDENLGRVLGLLAAGKVAVSAESVEVSLRGDTTSALLEATYAVKTLFGQDGLISYGDGNCSVHFASDTFGAFVVDFFMSGDYQPYLLRSHYGAAGAFLQVLVSLGGTGTVDAPKLATYDPELAWLVYSISARFKAPCTMRETDGVTILAWSGVGAALMDLLCTEGRIMGSMVEDESYIYCEVGHVEPLDRTEHVYDLEVEELHYYTANKILVHNTEFIRRFLFTPHYRESALRQRINPIRNSQPRWLPGSASEERKDRTYFIDLHTGVAQTKIPGGEYLLPGPGYEATHPLHSGVPGVYDVVDRFLVLSQAAPFSASYQDYYRKVRQLWPKLSPEWRHIVLIAVEQREARRGMHQAGSWTSIEALERANQQGGVLGALQEQWFGLTQLFQEMPIVGPKFAPALTPLERYKREVMWQATIPDWSHPIRNIVQPWAFTTLNAPPLVAALRGAMTGVLGMTRMGQMFAPFKIGGFQTAGLAMAGLISSGAREIAGANVVPTPQYVQQMAADEYLNYLKYVRARTLQERAESLGASTIASYYAQQAARTYVGAQTVQDYRLALPGNLRPYFDAFRYAPKSQRPLITAVVPDHMRQMLEKAWSGRDKSADRKISFARADEAASSYFQSRELPPPDSLVWHPDVSFDTIRIKMLQGGLAGPAADLHQFGYYQTEVEESESRYPDLTISVPSLNPPPIQSAAQAFLWSVQGGYRRLQYNKLAQYSSSPNLPHYSRISLHNTNRTPYIYYLQDVLH